MTLTVLSAHGGQWMFTITSADGELLASSGLYLNQDGARHAAEAVVGGFGNGTVVDALPTAVA